MTFHAEIRSRRKALGYSMEDVADKLGITRQAVSKWELGINYPRPDHLDQLCLLLQLEPPAIEECQCGRNRS